MDAASLIQTFASLVPTVAKLQEVPLEKVASIGASMIFVGVFVLQFFSIYRHGGRDAVVSILTWLLVACLCLAIAGFYWQQERDFFQAVLLLCLAAGAVSCFLVSLASRKTLEKEAGRRKSEAAPSSAAASAQVMSSVDAMRQRFARARTRSRET